MYTRNPEEARRRRISGLSRRTFVSTVEKKCSTLFFLHAKIFDISKLMPITSSLLARVLSRYFIGATHEHFRTKLKNTPGWRSWVHVTRANSSTTWFAFDLVSSLLNDFFRVEGAVFVSGTASLRHFARKLNRKKRK